MIILKNGIKEFNDFDRAEFRNDVIVIETSSNFANEEQYMKIYAGNIPFEFMAKTTKCVDYHW